MRQLILYTLTVACLAACKPDVGSRGTASARVQTRGITYELPFQRSSTTNVSSDSFSFTGDSLSITESGGHLTVNGKNYGSVKSGDTVEIDQTGAVTVNGAPRTTQ